MTIRTILLPIRGDGKGESVLDQALVLAKRHKAHLNVVHCRPRPEDMLPYGMPVTSGMKNTITGSASKLADEQEKELRALFDTYCRGHKIAEVTTGHPPKTKVSASWHEEAGRQAEIVAQRGRVNDLIAVPRPDRRNNVGYNTLEAAIFDSGRMVLMCPDTPAAKLGGHVALCWNGSREASHAVALGRPVLAEAEKVTVIAGAKENPHVPSAQDLVSYLASHGIAAKVSTFTSADDEVGAALLSAAADAGADCVMMGAFGQSRLRELVMGGATRHVVENARMPVFFAH